MCKFLRERGVTESVIDYLKNEKVIISKVSLNSLGTNCNRIFFTTVSFYEVPRPPY